MGKRRGHGEGTIYRYRNGWAAQFDLGIVDGRRRRMTIYGATQREVREKLHAVRHAHQQGIAVASESLTMAQYLAQWLDTTVKRTNKPKTYANYEGIVRCHLVPVIGAVPLAKLTPSHVEQVLTVAQRKGLSARTVRCVLMALRCALNRAIKQGLLGRNVATLVDMPRVESSRATPLTVMQAQALLHAVHGHRLAALYRILLGLGLRRGEVLALRWGDVDLSRRVLTVRAMKTKERTLALPAVLVAAVQAHWAQQQQERLGMGLAWREHGLVFPTRVGTPISGSNLHRHFKSVLRRAGLPATIRLHDLRHSCATFLIAEGVHPRVVMDILGHQSIKITMDVYGHVLDDTQRAAVEKLDALFG